MADIVILDNDTSETQSITHVSKFTTSETQSTPVAETHGTSVKVEFTQTWKALIEESSLSVSIGYSYDKTVTTGQSITKEKANDYQISADVGPGKDQGNSNCEGR